MAKYTRLLLVNPGRNRLMGICEPLNLAMLAAFVRERGYEVRLADQVAGQDVERVMDEFKPDLVGVGGTTLTAQDAYEIAAEARRRGHRTVMGGVHASVATEEALRHFDMVVTGEGEWALLDILQQGIESGPVASSKELDLDTCPEPARDLIPMDYYLGSRQRYPNTANYLFVPMRERILNVMAGRGCFWQCTFCHNTWRDRHSRSRNARLVADEMEHVASTYGVKHLCFMDDNLFQYKKMTRELFPELTRRATGILWGANARVDCMNEDNINAAWEAGCRRVNFGFESGSQRVLDRLKKQLRVEQFEKIVNLCRDRGMFVVGTFMVGNPGETAEDVELTRRMIRRLKLHHVGISITTPFPGTEIWEECARKGRIPEKIDWSLFDFDHVPIQVNDEFSPEQVMKLHRDLFVHALLHNGDMRRHMIRAFFANPMEIVRRVKDIALPA